MWTHTYDGYTWKSKTGHPREDGTREGFEGLDQEVGSHEETRWDEEEGAGRGGHRGRREEKRLPSPWTTQIPSSGEGVFGTSNTRVPSRGSFPEVDPGFPVTMTPPRGPKGFSILVLFPCVVVLVPSELYTSPFFFVGVFYECLSRNRDLSPPTTPPRPSPYGSGHDVSSLRRRLPLWTPRRRGREVGVSTEIQ